MRHVCDSCSVQLRVEEIGQIIIDTYQDPPVPYKITRADLLSCPGCGAKVVATDAAAMAYHYHNTFDELLCAAIKSGKYTVCNEGSANSISPAGKRAWLLELEERINVS